MGKGNSWYVFLFDLVLVAITGLQHNLCHFSTTNSSKRIIYWQCDSKIIFHSNQTRHKRLSGSDVHFFGILEAIMFFYCVVTTNAESTKKKETTKALPRKGNYLFHWQIRQTETTTNLVCNAEALICEQLSTKISQ